MPKRRDPQCKLLADLHKCKTESKKPTIQQLIQITEENKDASHSLSEELSSS